MLTISKDLFTSWNNAKLLYCHWKSNEHLLPGLNGETDLDVLLSRDNKEQGERVLTSMDFLKCKSQYGARYPDVDDWIGFDKATGALIHLHLHYSLITGHKGMKEYSLPWTELALRTRVNDQEYGVYVMDPNLELLTLYTRIGLKAGFQDLIRCRIRRFKLSKDIQREIDWLKERVDLSTVSQLIETYYGDNAADVISIIQNNKIDAATFLKMRVIAEKTFNICRRTNSFIRLREVSFFCYQKILKKCAKKHLTVITKKVPASGKGLTIAFLGQDGAGKTTVTKQLIKWWKWKLDVRYIYLGSGDNYSSLLRSIIKFLPSKGPIRGIRFILSLIDTRNLTKKAYYNILSAEKYANKGGVVIYDRFPQMKYDGICDGPKIRKRLQDSFGKGMLFRLFIPLAKSEEKYIQKIIGHHPNIVFKLILPPEESIKRKPQEKLEVVKRKHEIVKALHFEHSDVYTIDATMPYNEEMLVIKNTIWQHIQK